MQKKTVNPSSRPSRPHKLQGPSAQQRPPPKRPLRIDFESIAIAAGRYVFRTYVGYGYRGPEGNDTQRFDSEDDAWQAACYDNGLVPRPPGLRYRQAAA
jgi:hypothetical protein